MSSSSKKRTSVPPVKKTTKNAKTDTTIKEKEVELPSDSFEQSLSDKSLADWAIKIDPSKTAFAECAVIITYSSEVDKKKPKQIRIDTPPLKVSSSVTNGIGSLGQSNDHSRRHFWMQLGLEVSEEMKENEKEFGEYQKDFEEKLGAATYRIGELCWKAKDFQDTRKKNLIETMEDAMIETGMDEKTLKVKKKKAYEKAKASFIKDFKYSSFVQPVKEDDLYVLNVNRSAWIKPVKSNTKKNDEPNKTVDTSNQTTSNGSGPILPSLDLKDNLDDDQREIIYNHLIKDGYIHFRPIIREGSTGEVIPVVDLHSYIVTNNSMVVVGIKPYVYSKSAVGDYGMRWDFYEVTVLSRGIREEEKAKPTKYAKFAKPLNIGTGSMTDVEQGGFGGYNTDMQDNRNVVNSTNDIRDQVSE